MVPAKCSFVAAGRNRVSAITRCLNGAAHDLKCSLVSWRCLSQRDEEQVPCVINRTARSGVRSSLIPWLIRGRYGYHSSVRCRFL
jgi:hypothetical protein